MKIARSILTLSLLISLGCDGGDSQETSDTSTADAGATDASEEGIEPLSCISEGEYPEGWDSCISDDGQYHLAGSSTPSSAARVAAYEAIAELLWGGESSAEEFIQAELIYGEEGGVGSRITRRYDVHVPKPEGVDCKAEEAAQSWPEYCVGPSRIEPLILSAFEAGIAGTEPLINAHRIEAALIWFYYISSYKEAVTCATTAKDCDSSWAYYCGGKQLDETALGFGGLVQTLSPPAHAAIFQGLLALRCWRDLDSAESAEDEALHQRALEQLDPALDRGLAMILIQRIQEFEAASGATRAALWAGLEILGPVLNRGAKAQDEAGAARLEELWTVGMEEFSAMEALEILEELFQCSPPL